MLNFGRALLDQVVLERQGLDDRVGDDDLEPGRLVEEGVDPGAGAVGAQVASDPVPERPRLADVQGLPRPVGEQVDAGLFRQAGDLGLEITNRHAVHCAFARNPEPISIRLP
jgi:hypothetical protein